MAFWLSPGSSGGQRIPLLGGTPQIVSPGFGFWEKWAILLPPISLASGKGAPVKRGPKAPARRDPPCPLGGSWCPHPGKGRPLEKPSPLTRLTLFARPQRGGRKGPPGSRQAAPGVGPFRFSRGSRPRPPGGGFWEGSFSAPGHGGKPGPGTRVKTPRSAPPKGWAPQGAGFSFLWALQNTPARGKCFRSWPRLAFFRRRGPFGSSPPVNLAKQAGPVGKWGGFD